MYIKYLLKVIFEGSIFVFRLFADMFFTSKKRGVFLLVFFLKDCSHGSWITGKQQIAANKRCLRMFHSAAWQPSPVFSVWHFIVGLALHVPSPSPCPSSPLFPGPLQHVKPTGCSSPFTCGHSPQKKCVIVCVLERVCMCLCINMCVYVCVCVCVYIYEERDKGLW